MEIADLTSRLDRESLHAAYRDGALTPAQLVEALYDRMDREAAPGVWITRIDRARALAEARALGPFREDLPLYGIPFSVKDNIDVAGLTTTAACPAYAYVPSRSAPAVQALRDAGALCLGKVNMDQFATGLVGTRSPYGACENVFDARYLSGGSSSGSAISVAAHYVSVSLGTDTAGSGRVPAALNNIVGLKATRGLLPTEGVVPACASLDCVSVFAGSVADATRVRDTIVGLGRARAREPAPFVDAPAAFRVGIPTPLELFGDDQSQAAFEAAVARIVALGGSTVPVDFAPFAALGDLLYGAFVVERALAVGDFIAAHPDDVLPVTRAIILESSARVGARDAFRAFSRLAELRARCMQTLEAVDFLVTPTVPTHFTRADDAAEPRAVNDKLGIYTRFVNFVGCPVLSIPQDFRADGLPFGISLLALPGHDQALDGLAARLHAASNAGMGRLRQPLPVLPPRALRPPAREIRLAVVGAHMRGMPLHGELSERGARYVATVRTAPQYRLYALAGGVPERPGLVRQPAHGVAIEVELWDLSYQALGELMAKVPPPLAIGTLELEGGERVKGFVCEAYAVDGARDISAYGGYRAYVST